jgi:serine/threonine-protein kinase HipA
MRVLDVRFTSAPGATGERVGTLAAQRGSIYFEYAEEWLRTGASLSPFRLPFRPGLFEHRDRAFGPLPGLFADSLPDAWGMQLMNRYFRSRGQDPAGLGPLERLAWLGTRTMGALTYHPPAGPEGRQDLPFDLAELARQSRELLAGRSGEALPQLLRAGGSPGGARPKVLVGFDARADIIRSGEDDLPEGFDHWLVKFSAREDGPGSGPAEFAYAAMAKAAGLDLPQVRLFESGRGDRFFGCLRFDRAGNRRFHCHTFGNLIQTDYRIPACDYGDLLKATAVLTRNHQEVLKAFRRMVFNVLAWNRDDHAKNVTFLLDGEWRLAPAYDLTFSPGPGGEHSMTVAGEGRAPGTAHMLALARDHGIPEREAEAMIEEVRSVVGRWRTFAREAGVPRKTTVAIAARLGA